MFSRRLVLYFQAQCCLLLLGGALVSVAQIASSIHTPPAQPDPVTLHVTTRLVVLDVVVVDKAGRPVPNLDRSQFSITEDKVPQKLSSFDPPSGHAMPADSATHPVLHGTADLAKIGNAPVNILVFDELNTKWDDTAYARLQMESFLKSQPVVLTVPTLLLAAGNSGFVVLHDYTQSRAELLESIRRHLPPFPAKMMRGASGNTNIDLLSETLGTLSQIAESSRGTPGRKNLIWVGAGYPTLDTTTLTNDDEEKLMEVIRRVTDRMLTARVTLYMVDPGGVRVNVADSGAVGDDGSFVDTGGGNVGPYMGKLDFSTFVTATGGSIFANRNDVDQEIRQGVEQGGVYYTLSYIPTNGSDDAQKYRRIRVTLKDRSLRAVTRDGYFSMETPVDSVPSPQQKPSNQLQFDLASAARTRLVYNKLKVQAVSAGSGYSLLVGTKDLHWNDGPGGARATEVTVMTVFFNAKGRELQDSVMEMKEKIGPDVQIDSTSELALKLSATPPPGTARVRFVVRDVATGSLGTADAMR